MFVTFEGIDGCGKSTQAKMLFEALNKKVPALLTREPGGWEGGGAFRDAALGGGLVHPWSETFLFMLDRAEHVARVIEPALREGKNVLCERYHDSTLAYQSWGRGLPLSPLVEAASLARFPKPDVTLFFKISIETAFERLGRRGALDAFESEGAAFMERVSRGYESLREKEPKRWITIECDGASKEEIFSMAANALAKRGFFS